MSDLGDKQSLVGKENQENGNMTGNNSRFQETLPTEKDLDLKITAKITDKDRGQKKKMLKNEQGD